MENLTIIRKRYIPEEEVDISKDHVLVCTEDTLVTKWIPIKPREDFSWGISYVDLKDNYKISRFYDKNGGLLFWYCDILEVKVYNSNGKRKIVLTDLLIDVIVYSEKSYEIKDIDELEQAFEFGLIDKRQYDISVFAMNRLVNNIKRGDFPPKEFEYMKFESGTVDLHTHSCFSDGTFTPAELVKNAKKNNLTAIALTDHDTIDGIKEAEQEAEICGIEFVSGVEFSVGNVHILGYFPNGGIERLNSIFEKYMENRRKRAAEMARKLTSLGVCITYDEVKAEAGGDRFIGRVHLAKLIVKKGYASSIKEAFMRWIADDRPGYVKKEGYDEREVIELINKNGGVSVLAHPNQIKKGHTGREQIVQRLKGYGLMGIEVYYCDNTESETQEALDFAQKYNLVATGGSDFHGSNKPSIDIGRGKGNLRVPYECVCDLKNALVMV